MSNKQFTTVPTIRCSRSRFDMSFGHKMSMSVGKLYPMYLQEVYPGDTFSDTSTLVTRLTSTFLRPVMDNLFMDTYFFFVPSRLVYDRWEEIFGENRESYWAQPEAVEAPTIPSAAPIYTKSVGDYLGLPTCTKVGSEIKYKVPAGINILPFRAFALIWNEWFRDENTQPPVLIHKGDWQADEMPNNQAWSSANYVGMLPSVSKFHDLFTSALPNTQKGNALKIPIGGYAKVVPQGGGDSVVSPDMSKVFDFPSNSQPIIRANGAMTTTSLLSVKPFSQFQASGKLELNDEGAASQAHNIAGWNFYADLNDVNAVSVPDMRYAFQLQRILERSARSGTRYTEYILSAFGVQSPDSRLQRPEYLGGKRMPLSIQQVAQTSRDTENSALGSLGAFSLSNGRCGYSKGFVEHGFVIGVTCIRQHHTYQQGVAKMWQRKSRFDYYDPILANITEQPVYKSELFADSATQDNLTSDVFGYQEAWYDLRSRPSTIAGDMRSNSPTSLDIWHFADDFSVAPTLGAGFNKETPVNVDRTIAVPSSKMDQFIVDFYHHQSAVRCLPVYSIPGLIDHH